MDAYVADHGKVEFISPADLAICIKPPCPKPCIKQIKAKVAGTKSKRNPAKIRPDKVLKPSSVSDESLSGNKPVVLIRGCPEVILESVTDPPHKPVSWTVLPNENAESPPAITPTHGGKGAKLATDKSGSFKVVGTLGDCKVVWNVVFAWVKVDPDSSNITSQDTKFKDNGSGGGATGFESGKFVPGEYAWEAKVKLKVIGGGSSGQLGVGKVKVHILQNGIADTLTGNYQGGGTARETPDGSLPVVDATDDSSAFGSPFVWNPVAGSVTPANSAITDSDGDREVWTGDSPGGGFLTAHQNTGKPLQEITGVNQFETAIASVSDDAPNAIVVHAKTGWTADFKGNVDAGGIYTSHGAHVTKGTKFSLISDATGGQDACDAGFETFEPVFRDVHPVWTP